MHPFSIKESIRFGWAEFKKDPWFFAGVTFLLTLFSMIVNGLTGGGHGASSIIGLIISFLASTVVTIAYARLALSTVAGQHVQWEGLWAPQYFLSMLGATILQSALIMVGFILLIVPGIIACVLFMFTQLSVVDKNLGPVAALKESYRLTRPHLWPLFLFALALIGLNILGAVALVVGLLVTVPVSLIAVARVFRTLLGQQEPALITDGATPR